MHRQLVTTAGFHNNYEHYFENFLTLSSKLHRYFSYWIVRVGIRHALDRFCNIYLIMYAMIWISAHKHRKNYDEAYFGREHTRGRLAVLVTALISHCLRATVAYRLRHLSSPYRSMKWFQNLHRLALLSHRTQNVSSTSVWIIVFRRFIRDLEWISLLGTETL